MGVLKIGKEERFQLLSAVGRVVDDGALESSLLWLPSFLIFPERCN